MRSYILCTLHRYYFADLIRADETGTTEMKTAHCVNAESRDTYRIGVAYWDPTKKVKKGGKYETQNILRDRRKWGNKYKKGHVKNNKDICNRKSYVTQWQKDKLQERGKTQKVTKHNINFLKKYENRRKFGLPAIAPQQAIPEVRTTAKHSNTCHKWRGNSRAYCGK